jgi:circadian clock protein KaiB
MERQKAERWVLRLYVTGGTPRSLRAVANARRLCDLHLGSRHRLDVVDLWRDPAVARREQLLAAPTLVRERPLPTRRLVGDLSDTAAVLRGLGLPAEVTG